MRTPRRLLRALVSLYGLGALVGGVPALLVGIVGWPLPHGLPSPEAVGTALGDGWRPDDRFVMCFLALLLWVLWVQALRHVVGQVRLQLGLRRSATLTGEQTLPQVAKADPPRQGPLQRLVGWLVGGLMLASPLAPAAAVAAPAPPIPVVLSVTQAMADPLPNPAAAVSTSPSPEPAGPSYEVHTWAERRDCLWNIAERYLGDPLRWREIRDLNSDRVQADGRRLGDDPSSWVYPGWDLLLPADATGADVVVADAVTPPPGPATLVPAPAAPPAGATTPVPPPSTTVAPSIAATAASTAAANEGSATTALSRATPARSNGNAVVVSPWASRAALVAGLGLPTFALGGWLISLRRGRLAQASRCRAGRDVVRPVDPELEVLERRARAIAADQAEAWIDAALRALTPALAESSLGGTPEVRCVRAGDLGIEVLLAEPFPLAPQGWAAADGGHVWHPSPELDLADLVAAGAEQPALTPALVSLGATPEGPILADLEGFGVLAVEGDPERARAFLAGVALELASATWAEGVDLRVYGLDSLERIEAAVVDGHELLAEVRATADLLRDALAAHGSALGARIAGTGEPWYPMVVVVGPDADPAIAEALAEVATAGAGVAVVAAGALQAADWQLVVAPDGAAVLKPLGLGVRMGGVVDMPMAEAVVPEPAAAPTADLNGWSGGTDNAQPASLHLDQAGLDQPAIAAATAALAVVGEVDDVAAATPFVAATRARQAKLRRRQDCEVWVSVLRRSPEVTGWAKEAPGRRKLAEVLMYLTIYGADRPMPAAELRTNCWPPKVDEPTEPGAPPRLRDVSPEAFHQAMSRLRRQLGEGAAGWHLPLAVDGAYSPGPGVGCDWILFRGLVAAGADAGAHHETAEAIALYREALELVQGEPFADVAPGSCNWADAKHLVTDMQLAVSTAASDLAKLAITTEPETAVWAAQQGLLLLPTQLELFDTWMTAAAEMGDSGALDQCVQAKCWAHEQLDPDGGVAPETMELYRRLKAKLSNKELAGYAR